MGSIPADTIVDFVCDIHDRYCIHANNKQRTLRKQTGKANALLTVYHADSSANTAQWLLLFSEGEINSPEIPQDVCRSPYLDWLGYSLRWHTFDGKKQFTWVLSRDEMDTLFKRLYVQIKLHQHQEIAETLKIIAELPGFHGVTEQKWKLFRMALNNGYHGSLPEIHAIQKVKHGEPIVV